MWELCEIINPVVAGTESAMIFRKEGRPFLIDLWEERTEYGDDRAQNVRNWMESLETGISRFGSGAEASTEEYSE